MKKNEIEQYEENLRITSDINRELSPFKTREILVVATLYDSFIIEEEGLLSDMLFEEYFKISLADAPRITSVYSKDRALSALREKMFDLVILTMRIDDFQPYEASVSIRETNPDLPIFLLLNDNSDIKIFEQWKGKPNAIDKVFIWNGDAKIFLAMSKFVEDSKNVDTDTSLASVRVILLVEDSPVYYSRYLPLLYREIIKQTHHLIKEEKFDEKRKITRYKTRPKILLASTFEQALQIYEKYKPYVMCLITDMAFPKNGEISERSGIELIEKLKTSDPGLITLLQSSDPGAKTKAQNFQVGFIDKNSEILSSQVRDFIQNTLGFGPFLFKNENGEIIEIANNLEEFEEKIEKIPEESVLYHFERNDFATWFSARGEFKIAESLKKLPVENFESSKEIKFHLSNLTKLVEYKRAKGKIINFDDKYLTEGDSILRLCAGSLGGKARGIAFINSLLQNSALENSVPGASIKIPKTYVIGTDSFDRFIEDNGLLEFAIRERDHQKIKQKFLSCSLPADLEKKARILLQKVVQPLAVRSTAVFEDSISHPFSGIYETYIIPNSNYNFEKRFKQFTDAVKLVYASVYSQVAKTYFESIGYSIEEEKMAVVVQKLIGNSVNGSFYPSFSGVAQSYNYYPISYIKPEEGIAVLALGLGTYVVDGDRAFRFCPNHPKIDFYTPEDLLKNSQTYFWALDMNKNEIDLSQGEEITLVKSNLDRAEMDGRLKDIASVWDWQNNRFSSHLGTEGPRVINFANIIKYGSFPLADILQKLLNVFNTALGTPVEIEFAVELGKRPVFYILQLKPFIRSSGEGDINFSEIEGKEIFILTNQSLGNGKVEGIRDMICVIPERFDKMSTPKIAEEIECFNQKLKTSKKHYLLVGPGRWGTSDRLLGIPVKWNQISAAKTIVEYGMEGFQIDPSLGSHFFHNITSLNIGYLTIPFRSEKDFIDWQFLEKGRKVEEKNYTAHIEFEDHLKVLMDGRQGRASVYFD
ncbi:pyruvate, phosphate dikinase [candidate division WOR-3 bacterium]|nr:pyruvate, phosphate dikinase [candidate division WOR-3 bacterium]